MGSVGKIEKKVGSRFLSYYEMEAVHRDGSVSPYFANGLQIGNRTYTSPNVQPYFGALGTK